MNRLVRPAQSRMPRAVRRWFSREFAAIASSNADLRPDPRLYGLYLVPTTEEER